MLDGHEVPIASEYTVHAGVLEVPAAFEMTVGHASIAAELADLFPAFTPFQLYVGDTVVQTGETDGYATTGSKGSEVKLYGRDMLKWLVDTELPHDRTFAEKTFLQLTEMALAAVGLGGRAVATDNTANRKAITGTTKVRTTTEETQTDVATQGATRTVHKKIEAEIGTPWWDFLAEQYRRAGLFLWATVDGGFALARPNGSQVPLYRILRRRGGTSEPGEVTVLGQPEFSFDAVRRYTECHVTGRAGGGIDGRGQVRGQAFDREMFELLNPGGDYDRFVALASKAKLTGSEQSEFSGLRRKAHYVKDDKVQTREQAGFLARRKIAESRRNGWSLSYTVSGHTAPALAGGGRAIWAPDTVVHVVDDELGIDGPMYVESCVYERKPFTTTKLKLMRVEDLVFAEEDIDNPPKLQRKRGVANVRVGKTDVYRVQAMWRSDPNVWGGLPLQVRDTYAGLNPGVGEAEGTFVPDVDARRLR